MYPVSTCPAIATSGAFRTLLPDAFPQLFGGFIAGGWYLKVVALRCS
ncbi:MAG: hypothetical protein LC104_07965 [Bacteroidales bacterium]|nr:hypothetical protein [Bacteroidales bacterium]